MHTLTGLWLGAWGMLLGCSLTSDFDIHQCQTDAQCSSYAEARICEAERCVRGCESNAHCSAVDPETQLCPRRGDECAGLQSEGGECFLDLEYDARSMGTLRGEDLTLLGVFAPKVPVESASWQTYQLAARELNALGGLPGRNGTRPLLLTVCDGAAEGAPAALDHLLGTLHVRGIVASLEREALATVRDRVAAAEQEVLLLAPSTGVPRSSAAEPVWQTPDSPIDAAAYAEVIVRLAQRRGSLRVASLTSESYDDQALAVAVAQAFGEAATRSLSANANFVLADADPSARLDVLAQLPAFAPDLVLVFASGFFAQPAGTPRIEVLHELERAWPENVARPRYLLSPRNAGEELGSLSSDTTFPTRALAFAAQRAAPAPFEPTLPFASSGQREELLRAYDATYFLAYALAATALNDAPEPGQAQRALSSLVSAQRERVNVGPGELGLQKAVTLLATGAPFQLQPTTELPSPEPAAPAAPLSMRLYCPAVTADTTSAPLLAGDSLTYNPLRAAFEVALSDPEPSVLPACLEEIFGSRE